jgi:hypothetical protein
MGNYKVECHLDFGFDCINPALGHSISRRLDFPQYDFSLYFMTTLPEGEEYTLTPGTQEAHDYLWTMEVRHDRFPLRGMAE